MTTVTNAQTALDNAANKKNAADSSLIDAQAREKDLSVQLGRLLADSASTADVLAVRQERDQARQQVEDLESAIDHLTADVATAKQAVYQAKVAEAKAIAKEQHAVLETATDALEAAIQTVVKFKTIITDVGSKLRAAAITVQDSNPTRFSTEVLLEHILRDRLFNERGGMYSAPVAESFAAVLQDAEVL